MAGGAFGKFGMAQPITSAVRTLLYVPCLENMNRAHASTIDAVPFMSSSST